jgi:hypothetical protein
LCNGFAITPENEGKVLGVFASGGRRFLVSVAADPFIGALKQPKKPLKPITRLRRASKKITHPLTAISRASALHAEVDL